MPKGFYNGLDKYKHFNKIVKDKKKFSVKNKERSKCEVKSDRIIHVYPGNETRHPFLIHSISTWINPNFIICLLEKTILIKTNVFKINISKSKHVEK